MIGLSTSIENLFYVATEKSKKIMKNKVRALLWREHTRRSTLQSMEWHKNTSNMFWFIQTSSGHNWLPAILKMENCFWLCVTHCMIKVFPAKIMDCLFHWDFVMQGTTFEHLLLFVAVWSDINHSVLQTVGSINPKPSNLSNVHILLLGKKYF